ncbi:hypothetical protein Bca4012_064883 [Brassica carinata]|uniref:Uncharacterized protein n=1 Tax=Brassica carinata TaxID=52824 RepID=A0A8X7VMX7_BRACI|nr:hypothetical protein Bca52824_017333 [Brassica carinata]
MDSAHSEFNKRPRLFEDHENKDAKVTHSMIPESTTPLNKGYDASTTTQNLFAESKPEVTMPKVLKKRGRKKKNPNPGSVIFFSLIH